jgi:hypothetical protein
MWTAASVQRPHALPEVVAAPSHVEFRTFYRDVQSRILQWEDIHAEGRQTTADDWMHFVRMATSWGDRAFRKNMVWD